MIKKQRVPMSKKELIARLRKIADQMAFQAACARREKELRLKR